MFPNSGIVATLLEESMMPKSLLQIDLASNRDHHDVQEWLPWDEVLTNQLHLMDVSLLSSMINGWRAFCTPTFIG